MSFLNSIFCAGRPSPRFVYVLWLLIAVGCFVPKSLVSIPIFFGILNLPYLWQTRGKIPSGLFLSFLGFMMVALISCFLSPDLLFSLEKWVKSFAICLCAFGCFSFFTRVDMDKKTLMHITLLMTGTIGLAALYLYIEYAHQYPIYRALFGIEDGTIPNAVKGGYLHNRASVFVALLVIPAICLMRRNNFTTPVWFGLAAFVLIPAFFMTLVSESQTSLIVLVLALISFLYPYEWKHARLAAMTGIVAMLVLTPFVMPSIYTNLKNMPAMTNYDGWLYKASAINRLEVWDFLSREVVDSPVFGHGMEATRFLRADAVMPRMGTDHIMHPHNLSIQLWVETGILGVLTFLVFAAFLYKAAMGRTQTERFYFFVMLMPVLANLSMSYGMWQLWQLGMICAMAALITTAAIVKEDSQA